MNAKSKRHVPEYSNPLQLILFGSPGTGKSHKVKNEIAKNLNEPDLVNTVFHPEYTYGDFMGKLMPISVEGKVEYRYYPGAFMKALGKALHYYIKSTQTFEGPRDVVLVIDEINRGNSAAIFGSVFQLLDRNADGWSSYSILISDMEREALLSAMKAKPKTLGSGRDRIENWVLDDIALDEHEMPYPYRGEIKLPPNLSIVCTMNTSDESIYYMDSAFKRRWSWEYMPPDSDVPGELENIKVEGTEYNWVDVVREVNSLIKESHEVIRKIEDKQIGYFFIRPRNDVIARSDIQNKLMFFLWDSVFSRNKAPLCKLMNLESKDLVTFGDFSSRIDKFMDSLEIIPF